MVVAQDREREAEVAKLEYLVYSWTLIHGIDQKTFDRKMEALRKLKQSMAEVVHQDTYNIDYQKAKKKLAADEQETTRARMKKLADLGKKG